VSNIASFSLSSHRVIIDQHMAATTTKRFCTTCSKERGIFKCDGCSQIFCLQHTTDHHRDVVKQLNQVEEIRDLVQGMLTHEPIKSRQDMNALHNELMKTIDDWEQKSISEIQKVAAEARNELVQYTTGRFTNMKLKLEQINNELQQARQKNDFIETDLREWENKLKKMKEELINPPNVVVREDYTKLIPKIRVNLLDTQEAFERSSGNADFEEKGKVVYLKNDSNIYTEVRGKFEYTTGQHTLCLKVEQLNGWILFGIISKSTPLQIHSYTSSSCYGWYNSEDFVYAGGENIGGQGSDIVQNDTIHLVIDCDERVIRLKNERTEQMLELQVDTQKCPFPWQLHLNLNAAPTRIRLI